MNGTEPVDVPLPTPARLVRVQGQPERTGYSPTPGSGGYAILIAIFLAEKGLGYRGSMHKDQICRAAQRFCRTGTVMNPSVSATSAGGAGGAGRRAGASSAS